MYFTLYTLQSYDYMLWWRGSFVGPFQFSLSHLAFDMDLCENFKDHVQCELRIINVLVVSL